MNCGEISLPTSQGMKTKENEKLEKYQNLYAKQVWNIMDVSVIFEAVGTMNKTQDVRFDEIEIRRRIESL